MREIFSIVLGSDASGTSDCDLDFLRFTWICEPEEW